MCCKILYSLYIKTFLFLFERILIKYRSVFNGKMIPIKIMTQPDDVTCGPTSLHAVYNYFGDKISLPKVISEISYLEEGGTLAVMLAIHALKRNYKAKIYTYNLSVFDPVWFKEKVDIKAKLVEQKKHKKSKKLHHATDAYIEYLSLGGEIEFVNLTPSLFKKIFDKKLPILTGLSATYLYNCSREAWINNKSIYDDVRGFPTGHFVVLSGYDEETRNVVVADPYLENPVSHDNYYSVKVSRLINSIMLGILTFDANLLVIQPKDK